MTDRIRVLITDDSATIRMALARVLKAFEDIEVVGQAANGELALQHIESDRPDVVLLDVEMPVMDGLTALVEIRKRHPALPVIMFSTLTDRGAKVTIDALTAGASDYAPKPNAADRDGLQHAIAHNLVPKIRALGRHGKMRIATPAVPARLPASPMRTRHQRAAPDLLAIGCSTGGPNALAAVLGALPADLPVPVVIVQHMPPMFTAQLARRLDARSKLNVREAVEGAVLQAGDAWIAPGDHHMVLRRQGFETSISLNRDPPVHSCRPSVDVMLQSVATHYPGRALVAVLTGMGADGSNGVPVLRASGCEILVQDEATSVVWGMPGHIAKAGQADQILPIGRMAHAIVRSLYAPTRRGRDATGSSRTGTGDAR